MRTRRKVILLQQNRISLRRKIESLEKSFAIENMPASKDGQNKYKVLDYDVFLPVPIGYKPVVLNEITAKDPSGLTGAAQPQEGPEKCPLTAVRFKLPLYKCISSLLPCLHETRLREGNVISQ